MSFGPATPVCLQPSATLIPWRLFETEGGGAACRRLLYRERPRPGSFRSFRAFDLAIEAGRWHVLRRLSHG